MPIIAVRSIMKKNLLFVFAISAACLGAMAAPPANYYNSADGKSGTVNLLNALEQIIGDHTVVSYDGLWDLYETSDVDANGKIWDMYSTKRWTIGKEHCGNYSNVGDCINREHSMPKSWFNEGRPMYSDAFHLYPTDGKVNGQRGNYPYGECASGKNLGTYNGVTALGRLGKSTFSGYSGTVFEPDDEYKGDFARSYFYMAAAYYDRNKTWDSDMLSGDSNVFTPWAIQLLLKWHRQDPVSNKETARNEAVYKAQKNRNPFIDHPELAEYIWGDKKGETWSSRAASSPELNSPLNGTSIDMGLTAVNYPLSYTLPVKGQNLTADLSISVSSSDFKLSTNSLSYTQVNNGKASLTITFSSATAKTSTATLTLTSGSLKTTVTLRAQAVTGIPALAAEDVDEDSFTARWQPLGDFADYTLDVRSGGVSIQGYPKSVKAATGRYSVTNLDPETTYTYTLSSDKFTSNTITVTTLSPMPEIWVTNNDPLRIEAVIDEPSDAIEIWIDVDNIVSDITVSVREPFLLSDDKNDWNRQITISPDQQRIYARVLASTPGEYESPIVFTTDSYLYDDAELYALVVDPTEPWFVETFEVKADSKSYEGGSFSGSTGVWNISDFGLWKSDGGYESPYCGRFGQKTNSYISTAAPKRDGIGTVKFFARRWSASDGNATFAVQYSTDNNVWTTAGSVTVNTDNWNDYAVGVNVPGNLYFRLQQTAGKRAKIDNLSISDCRQNSVDEVLADDWQLWDAYSSAGQLVIESSFDAPTLFTVYTVEGKTLFADRLSQGQHTLRLTAGVYIVGCGETARKVLVK